MPSGPIVCLSLLPFIGNILVCLDLCLKTLDAVQPSRRYRLTQSDRTPATFQLNFCRRDGRLNKELRLGDRGKQDTLGDLELQNMDEGGLD